MNLFSNRTLSPLTVFVNGSAIDNNKISTILEISGFLILFPITVNAYLALSLTFGLVSLLVKLNFGTIIGKHIDNYLGAQ